MARFAAKSNFGRSARRRAYRSIAGIDRERDTLITQVLGAASVMIGDRWRDIDCGQRAGVKTVFIDLGYAESLHRRPDHIVTSFTNATAIVLAAGRP